MFHWPVAFAVTAARWRLLPSTSSANLRARRHDRSLAALVLLTFLVVLLGNGHWLRDGTGLACWCGLRWLGSFQRHSGGLDRLSFASAWRLPQHFPPSSTLRCNAANANRSSSSTGVATLRQCCWRPAGGRTDTALGCHHLCPPFLCPWVPAQASVVVWRHLESFLGALQGSCLACRTSAPHFDLCVLHSCVVVVVVAAEGVSVELRTLQLPLERTPRTTVTLPPRQSLQSCCCLWGRVLCPFLPSRTWSCTGCEGTRRPPKIFKFILYL